MTTPFKAISLSYKNAPIAVREHFAMNPDACRNLLQYAKDLGSIDEMLVISTCNRFEVYFVSDIINCEQLTAILKPFAAEGQPDDGLRHFQFYEQPVKAVEHLFRVAMGLESQVLGDLQIINQLKEAYQNSTDLAMAGLFIHRLMHTIFHTHKRVTQESCFKDCHASVSLVAKKLVQRLLPDKKSKVLILGAGMLGADLCRKLSKLDYEVWTSNRTEETSLRLAQELGLKSIPFKDIALFLNEVQLVISAITVDEPILDGNRIQPNSLNAHKYLIDLSLPRSIAPELLEDPDITLLNMDDINDEISSTLQKRRDEIPKVESIINSALLEFLEWAQELKVLPIIHQMKAALENIRREEIARHLKQMDFKEHELINDITKRIVDRVVKLPALKLKLACKRGEDENMAQVLHEIFNINTNENQLSK